MLNVGTRTIQIYRQASTTVDAEGRPVASDTTLIATVRGNIITKPPVVVGPLDNENTKTAYALVPFSTGVLQDDVLVDVEIESDPWRVTKVRKVTGPFSNTNAGGHLHLDLDVIR